ncbi:ABC transporter ATP-binding protein [Weissella viridescens]|uniref:ABC transporter ATP-binding protein n=1 Tax=Weissella viridescens TaxID=1629 RepID=A0A3P2REG4_WEIVI|nr:ABC transporter ATP-binding protein [Weissella viridescens]RRG17805.1 ABC transporter ATP-binding protein [Weissella viridescens]
MSIKLKHLKKTYDNGEEVLKDINTEIEDGQFYVLVGASGSGKSTILNAIAGFIPINEGVIEINGRDVTNLSPKDRHLAMVFQNYALMPNLTVSENIIFGLKARHVDKAVQQDRLNEVLQTVHLTEYKDKRPANLSGGQRQRVSLARALVSDANVILMDEPLSNLDAKLRAEMRREIRALQQHLGLTVIYVTHDQTEAMTMGDQVMLLNQGRIEQIGSPLELYNTPENTYVADFFGSPAINLLDAKLTGNQLQLVNGVKINFRHTFTGDVRVGIRPENVQLTPQGSFNGKITHIEPLGDGTNVSVEIGTAEPFRLKVSDQLKLHAGDQISFDILPEQLMIFDTENQLVGLGPLTELAV